MALVTTFMNAGAASAASGINCFATGLLGPACITAAIWQPTSGLSLPIQLSRTGLSVMVMNCNSVGVGGDLLAFFAHSVTS